MKLYLGVSAIFVASCALFALGACSDDTGTNTTSNTSSSSSGASSSSSSGETSTSSSGSSGMTSTSSSGSSGMTSSSSSSGSGGYTVCSDCTSVTNGAWVKECKTSTDACQADAKCLELLNDYVLNCSTDAAGGCCTFATIKKYNTPQASQALFFAMDNCVYCKECKTLCAPEAGAYCAVTAAGGASCPP